MVYSKIAWAVTTRTTSSTTSRYGGFGSAVAQQGGKNLADVGLQQQGA